MPTAPAYGKLAVAAVIPLSAFNKSTKAPKKRQKGTVDGITGHPVYPDITTHYELILASPFPCSFWGRDNVEIKIRIFEKESISPKAVDILWALIQHARYEAVLIFDMHISPCSAMGESRCLVERTHIEERTYQRHFAEIGVTYKNTTSYNAVKGDKFQGKYAACIRGNGHVKTKFLLNLEKLCTLGESINVCSFNDHLALGKKASKQRTILKDWSPS